MYIQFREVEDKGFIRRCLLLINEKEEPLIILTEEMDPVAYGILKKWLDIQESIKEMIRIMRSGKRLSKEQWMNLTMLKSELDKNFEWLSRWIRSDTCSAWDSSLFENVMKEYQEKLAVCINKHSQRELDRAVREFSITDIVV